MALKPFDGDYDPIDPAQQGASQAGAVRPTGRLRPFSGDYDPLPKKPGVLGTLKEGAKSTGRALASAVDAYSPGDGQRVVDRARTQREAPKAQKLEEFYSDIEAGRGEDDGLGDALRNVGGAVVRNPGGAGLAVVEQLPNAAPALGGGWAGMKGGAAAGAAVGSLFGPAGTGVGGVAGGVLGGLAGMFLGNAAIETGHKAMGLADDGDFTADEAGQARREGRVKGGVITGVDAITLGAGRLVSSGLQRTVTGAMEGATRKALVDQGVNVADEAAVAAALRNPDIVSAVHTAQGRAIEATDTLRRRVGEGSGLLAMESVGEGVGEYLGELAATGEADITDAVLESILSLGQSGVETVWNVRGSRAQRDMIQPLPTEDNPNPAPVDRPDPAAGALSRAAAQLPSPDPVLGLPAPESVMYADSDGSIQDTGPVVNVDGVMQPTAQARPADIVSERPIPGMEGQAPVGIQPNAIPAEEQRRIDQLARPQIEQERADLVSAHHVNQVNAQIAEAMSAREAAGEPAPRYPAPKGLELADRQGHGRWQADVYRESVQALVNQLTKGGDVAYVRDANDRITGRTPSVNPSWWQNMDASVKPGSVEQAQRIVSKALVGGNLGPKQARFIAEMMNKVDDLRTDPQRAEQDRAVLAELERASAARNQQDHEQGVERGGVSEQDDAELSAYLSGQAEPFRLSDLTPEDYDAVYAEVVALDDTADQTAEAGAVGDTETDFQGVFYGNNQRAGQAGSEVPAQQGVPGGGREAGQDGGAVPAGREISPESTEGDAEAELAEQAGQQRQSEGDEAGSPDQQVPASIEGRDIDGDWAEFSADSGTLSIPRSDMPQIRAEHRGAMVQFLAARDIGRQEETVPASSLKPTQAEYSRKKVEKAKAFTGGNRSILVSADGHVLDGHHQWMAARDAGEDVKIIRLDAPISELLPLAHEFPSSSTDGGAVESTAAPGRQEEAGQVSAPEGVSLNQLQQRDVAEGRPGLAGELTPSTMASLAAMRNNPNVPAQQVGRNGAYTDTIPFIDVGDGFEVRGYSINGEVRQEIRLPNGMIATRGLLPDGSIYGSAEGNFEQIVEGQGFPEIEQYFTEFAQARKRRAVTPAIEQAAPTPIEDAGEKLGGARKDELRTVRERLDDMGDEAIASSKLSELWPKGEVDRITDPFHAAAYHAVRAHIPTKPRVAYRVKRWVDQVKAARGLLADLAGLGADASVARMREHSPSLNILADQIELYMGIDRAHWGRVSDAKIRNGRYSQDGEMVPGSWVELKIDKRGKSFYGHDSIASALPAIRSGLEQKAAPEKKQKFNIYTRTATGEVFISADADKERRALKSFESTGEARKYMDDHHGDLVAAWEAVKNRENVTKADMRRKANEARVGQDYRGGKDVTPEQFLEQFGFRGVEFGNWVKQGKGGQERQGVLNDAYDAFMDLASAIGVPPRALSLEGRLGIGFGSRGAGWASAHFESDTVVINLTKTRGAGALAHEWFHAMDNYFAHKRGVPQFTGDNAAYRKEAFVTYRPEPMMVRKDTLGTRYRLALTRADLAQRRERNPNDPQLAADAWVTDPEHKQGVRPVVEKSFAELVHTLNSSPMAKRARVIDKGKADGYWSQIIERGARAFETYVIARLADQGARNDYLANVQTLEEFSRNPDRYPYLTPDEQGPVNEAFDKLFSTIETRETDSGDVAMFRRTAGASAATLSRRDVEKVAARLVTEATMARRFVLTSWEQLPKAIKDTAAAQGARPGDIKAVHWRGKTYLVDRRFTDARDVERTIFHEYFAHYGLRQRYGKDLERQMNGMLRGLGGVRGVQAMAESQGLNIDHYVEGAAQDTSLTASQRGALLMDELLAHMAESTGTLRQTLQEWLGAVRNWLRERGYAGLARLTAADLSYELRMARQAALAADAVTDGGPVFSRIGRAADTALNLALRTKATTTADAFTDLSPAQKNLLGKVGPPPAVVQAKDWLRARMERAGTRIRQGIVDRYASLKELDEQLHGKDFIENAIHSSSWVLARMSSAASGAMQAMMSTGRLAFDAKERLVTLRDDKDTGGLTGLLAQLGSPTEVERWFGWVAANRADKLANEWVVKVGKKETRYGSEAEARAAAAKVPGARAKASSRENLFTADEIAAGKTLNTGRTEGGESRAALYARVHREFQQYRDDVLAIAEQTGIISAENRSMWRDEFYVPFYRVMDEDASSPSGPRSGKGLSRQEAYKKLKGGKQNLNDLLENTLMNFHHLLSASLKNQAATQVIENAQAVGIARRVPESNRDTKTSTFILRNGKKEFYQIDDGLVFEALTALADPGLNNLAVQVMSSFKRVFTNMTTVTPQFIMANTLRDQMQAAATSPASKNVIKNLVQGTQGYRDATTRAEMLASGGAFSFGHIYGADANEVKASLQRTLKGAELVTDPRMIPKVLTAAWRKWGDIADTAENSARAAIYQQNVEQRGRLRASFEARDLMDFSQHGAFPAVRFLIRVVPFLNARLQGLDKLYRAGVKPSLLTAMGKGTASDKQAAQRFAIVTGALTVASIALYLANVDDDEFRKLEDWQKDSYWPIRIGNSFFFIPKPFEVGAIATMAERMTEQVVDDKATGKLFADRLKDMLLQTFSFSPVPQAFQPVLDVYSNRDAFTGRQIETMGMERLSKGLRSRDSTTAAGHAVSAVSRALGDDSPVALSPVQADHLIRGYLGAVGANAAGIIDTVWRSANGEEAPDKRWSERQPFRRFYRDLDLPVSHSRYSTLFYEGLREAGRVYADVKELQQLGRTADARELQQDKRNILALRRTLNQQQRRISQINKQMEQVRRSDRDGAWKRRELDRLTLMRNRITEQAGKRVEVVRASG